LPVRRRDIVSLGEAETPLVPLPRLAPATGGGEVLVKDEGRLPTGSFKARGLAVAISMAASFGIRRVAVPTAGNAGAAAAAYARRAGMEAYVFTPDDVDETTVREIAYHGGRVYRVNGLINECARVVRQGTAVMDWFDLTTLAEPYRIEGKKTMGLELAEQLDWELPDAIFYPTGGGTGFIGMWKAFAEMEAMGWIGAARPRMVCVQSTGCGPIVKAFEDGADHVAEPWPNVDTGLHGVRVAKPLGDRLILSVIRESDGLATAVDDAAVAATRAEVASQDGVHLCPEGAACVAAYRQELTAGRIGAGDRVVLFNTASGLKSLMPPMERHLDVRADIDYASL
jgi:threonine synthase